MREFLVVGASGHGREVASVLADAIDAGMLAGACRGFVDDDPALHGSLVNGLPVVGTVGSLDETSPSMELLLGLGYPETKRQVLGRLPLNRFNWPVLVHPTASVGSRVSLERGSFVQAGAVLSVNIEIDEFVTVNIGATISHDCFLGAFSTVSPGANLGGRVQVGDGAFVGIGASVIQNVRIGTGSVVGAGAVVVEDVPADVVVAGVPARVIRELPERWQDG